MEGGRAFFAPFQLIIGHRTLRIRGKEGSDGSNFPFVWSSQSQEKGEFFGGPKSTYRVGLVVEIETTVVAILIPGGDFQISRVRPAEMFPFFARRATDRP